MRYLLDKVTARRILEGMLKLVENKNTTDVETSALYFYRKSIINGVELYILYYHRYSLIFPTENAIMHV